MAGIKACLIAPFLRFGEGTSDTLMLPTMRIGSNQLGWIDLLRDVGPHFTDQPHVDVRQRASCGSSASSRSPSSNLTT